MIIDERNSYSKKSILDNDIKRQIEEFKHGIDSRNIDKSINIGIELHCSGKFKELWDILLRYHIQYIHIIDKELIIKLYIKYKRYIEAKKRIHQKIALRNINILRKDIVELIGLITLIPKRDIYQYIPGHYYYHEYNKNTNLLSYNKLSNYDKYYVQEVINENNVNEGMMNALKEIELKIKELLNSDINYNVNESIEKLIYWVGFILSYTPGNNDHSQFLDTNIKELKKMRKTKYVWILWNILLKYSKDTENYKMICSLYNFFSENTTEHTHLYLVVACLSFYLKLNLNNNRKKEIYRHVYEKVIDVDNLYQQIQDYIDNKNKEKKKKEEEKEKRRKENELKKKIKEKEKENKKELERIKSGNRMFEDIMYILPKQKVDINKKVKININIENEINNIDEETNEKIIKVKMKNMNKYNNSRVNIEKEGQ